MIVELIVECVVEPVAYFIGYWTGKPIIRVLSLGHLHVEFRDPVAKQQRARKWRPNTFVEGGRRYVDVDVVVFVGWVFWVLVIVAVVLAM